MGIHLLVLIVPCLILVGCWGEETKPPPPVTEAPMIEVTVPKEGMAFTNSLGLLMVWCPAGSFEMGKGTNHSLEKPIHKVTFDRGFWMSSTEMTQSQYKAVIGANPSHTKGESHPVENVNFNEAQTFCNKLTSKEKKEKVISHHFAYQLPSEAQWEYACVAGTKHPTYGLPIDEVAWHRGNAKGKHHPVGMKRPNPWGLYDMLGNVSEWCADPFHDNYEEAPTDGSPWLKNPKQSDRMTRGGNYNKLALFCCSYVRRFYSPSEKRAKDRGMRIVLTRK